MDSVTHTVLGICAGEAIAGKKLGKKAMLIGAIANNIPDIDVASSLWLSHADSLLAHRGITHSFLFCIVFTLLVSWLLRNVYRDKDFHFKDWVILIGSGMFFHIGLDALTVYGTGWFEPFSHYRVSLNTIFVADPFYTLSLLVAAAALLILKRSSSKRKIWTQLGLGISSAYLIFTIVNKFHINEIAERAMNAQKISNNNYMATPTPLNNFLWYIVQSDSTGFHIGYYSLFDKSTNIQFRFVPRNDSILKTMSDNENIKKLLAFSQGYFLCDNTNDSLAMCDLRFGQLGGWEDLNAQFVFRFYLGKNADNEYVIQQGRMKGANKKAFGSLWKRIKGI
jgi:inner membrane protein